MNYYEIFWKENEWKYKIKYKIKYKMEKEKLEKRYFSAWTFEM